jgi:hypothetical protein
MTEDIEAKTIKPGQYQNISLDKQKLIKRANAIKAEGQTWEATWKELSTYLYPTKGFFGQVAPNQGSKIDHKTLIDEEATLDIDTFAAGMMSGFTSPTRPWFRLYLDDDVLMEITDVKLWLEDVQSKMRDIFQKSNTYSALTAMYTELAIFGTACAFVEEDFYTVIRLHNYTAGEYYLSRDAKGRLSGFYHRFWMTTGQMVKEFGLDNVSPQVQNEYQTNSPDTWHIVNHLVEENDSRIPFLKDYANMAYRSAYWEDGSIENSYLRIGGFEEWPVLGPRWETTTNADSYGKGPGWKVLGAVKELQKKVKNLLIALDKKTNPPLQKDASVIGDVNTMPGGITTFSSQLPNAGVRETYQVNLDINALELSIDKTRQKIKKFFFADLFLMMIESERSGAPITATEIAERQSERISKVGPILELWQGDEFIKALIDRTFAIGMRNGIFPPPPQEIQGMDVKIQYTSVLAQAQKMIDIQAIDIWVAGIMQEAGINSSSLDIINFDEKNRKKAEMLGVPPSLLNSIEQIAAMRKQKAQMIAQAQQQQSMMNIAEAAKKGASAMKDAGTTPVGEGSALDGMMASIKGMQQQ